MKKVTNRGLKLGLKRKVLLALGLLEEFLNNYDKGLEGLYHPGRYLSNSFGDLSNQRSFKSTLSQLVVKGLVSKQEQRYRLTPLGWSKLKQAPTLRHLKEKTWDGLWRVVVYDIPEEKRNKRLFFRRHLKDLGFRLWQKSTWITPLDVSQELYQLLKENQMAGRISVFESRNLFGLTDKQLTAEIWPVNKLYSSYQSLVDDWETAKMKALNNTDQLRDMARKIQNQYWEILIKDPGLPVDLLPEKWPKDKLNRILREIQQTLSA